MYTQSSIAILSFIGLVLTSTSVSSTINPVQAETGKGADVFKVIMTIFGIDETKGDVVAVVTAKNEEAKVKLFDASGPESVPLNASEGGGRLIEYVATFPNVTVNSGDPYKACIFTVKDLDVICKEGQNSPAARPEFVDLSLNTTRGEVEQVDEEEEEEGNNDDNDGVNEMDEDNITSPGIPLV